MSEVDLDIVAEKILVDIEKENVWEARCVIPRVLPMHYSQSFFHAIVNCSRKHQNKLIYVNGMTLGVLTSKWQSINDISSDIVWDTAPPICRGVCVLNPYRRQVLLKANEPTAAETTSLVDIVLPKGESEPPPSLLSARVRRKIGIYLHDDACDERLDVSEAKIMLQMLADNNVDVGPVDVPRKRIQMDQAWCFTYPVAGGDGAGPSSERVMYVSCLGVVPMVREGGLGTLLLRNVMKCAYTFPNCRYVCLHVQTDNITALRFYKRHGFRIIRRVNDYYPRLEVSSAFLLAWSPWEYCLCPKILTQPIFQGA